MDFAGFKALYRQLKGAPEDGETEEHVGQAAQQLSEQEIFAKFNQWDTDQDDLLYPPDIRAMLMHEFGFPDDAGTDGVLDAAMEQFAQFDADSNGSIDASEFIALWNHFAGSPLSDTLAPPLLPSLDDQELSQKFDMYDADLDGLLNLYEVRPPPSNQHLITILPLNHSLTTSFDLLGSPDGGERVWLRR